MIIGIDASRANSQTKTGTEWYAYYLIQEFKKIADPQDQFILYSKELLTGGLSDLPINFKSRVLRWPPKFLWTQLRLAWEMIWHAPDVLFVPAHTIPIIHPKNTITTLHDVGFERFQYLYSNKNIGPKNKFLTKLLRIFVKLLSLGKYDTTELDYHRWSARMAVRRAKKIITISKFSKDEIQKFFKVPNEKLIIISNAPSPAYRQISDQRLINKTLDKYKITKPFFLYIGRLEEKKNIPRLIEAFSVYHKKNNSPVKLVLVGSPGYGYEKIERIIKQENIREFILEPGWINGDDLPSLMNASVAFVFPSAYEGFGIPIIEAMKSGTPVITSNYGAMKEISGSAALLIDSNNATEITLALEKIISDKPLRKKLIQAGLIQAKNFNWEVSAAQTLSVIKSIK